MPQRSLRSLDKMEKLAMPLVFTVIGAVFVYLLVACFRLRGRSRLPDINPISFVAAKRAGHFAEGKKTVVCIGDSITHGRVSYNYVNDLAKRPALEAFNFVNGGVNGELSWNLLQRLDDVVACKPDIITILIGTNDVNSLLLDWNTKRAMRRMNLPTLPSKDGYRANLRQICRRLKQQTDAKILLISLPTIGEVPETECFARTLEYSDEIRKVSEEERVDYLPFNESMVSSLEKMNVQPTVKYADWYKGMMKGILAWALWGRSFEVSSRKNGFVFHTDFLHLNQKGGIMLADLIESYLV